jgi:hypothetical protein
MNFKTDKFRVEDDIMIPQMLKKGMFFSVIIIHFDLISIAYLMDLKSLENKKEMENLVNLN